MCDKESKHNDPPKPVVKIGRYIISETISVRKNSTVFKAFDPDLQRFVSLKTYHGKTSIREKLDRVVTEARGLAKVENPYVARCHHIERVGDNSILVNEWIEGQNLQQHHAKNAISLKQARSLVLKIAKGVAAIHEQGLLHRDIKPTNVIVDPEGNPKVIDLGLVQDFSLPAAEFSGTSAYVAPEVANQQTESIGPPTDIFGLGGVLYFLLTGHAVYEADSKNELLRLAKDCEIVPPNTIVEASERELDRICLKCLNRHPDQRYQSARELISALEPAKTKVLVSAGLMAIMAIALIGWWANLAPAPTPQAPEAQMQLLVLDDKYDEALKVADEQLEKIEVNGSPIKLRSQLENAVNISLQIPELDRAEKYQQEIVELNFEHGSEIWRTDALNVLQEIQKLRDLTIPNLNQLARGLRIAYRANAELIPGSNQFDKALLLARSACENISGAVGEDHYEAIKARVLLVNCLLANDKRGEVKDVLLPASKRLTERFGEDMLLLLEIRELETRFYDEILNMPFKAYPIVEWMIDRSRAFYGKDALETKSFQNRKIEIGIRQNNRFRVVDIENSKRLHAESSDECRDLVRSLESMGNEPQVLFELSRAKISLGEIHLGKQVHDDCIAVIAEAIQLASELSTESVPGMRGMARTQLSRCHRVLADNADEQNKFLLAANHTRKSVDILTEFRMLGAVGVARGRTKQAQYLAWGGESEKALQLVAVIVELMNSIEDSTGKAELHLGLAIVMANCDELEKLTEMLNKAVEHTDMENPNVLQPFMKVLTELHQGPVKTKPVVANVATRLIKRIDDFLETNDAPNLAKFRESLTPISKTN